MTLNLYCTAPWSGITIRENGKVKTCCAGTQNLADLNVDPVDSIEQSPVLFRIRNQMLNGQPDVKNCSACINLEKIDGYVSLRNHYNTYYPDPDINQLKLKFIDLRWNNTCNLSCMYCSPIFSSTWADKLKQVNMRPVRDYQDNLLKWVLERAGHVKEILLLGGEPLLMKQNYELLKVLPQDCRISIITNLSYNLQDLPCLPDLLARPANNIIWNVSADNTHQQFEYVRHGASWDQLVSNIKFLNQTWPETLSLNMVYSMFNAVNLSEIFKTFMSMGVQKFNLLPIEENATMNVSLMTDPIRQVALSSLINAVQYHRESLHPEDRDLYYIQGADQLMQRLEKQNNNESITLDKFEQQIAWYDQWNNVPFKDLWPDVVKLTKQYLV
jgi:MoaA/NifB/PqqE/SkfB family radical SAM enzyme